MHHLAKKAAIAKYAPLHTEGKTEEEIKEAIAADEKGYSPEELEEIYTAIAVGVKTIEQVVKEEAPAKKAIYPLYDEWSITPKAIAKPQEYTGPAEFVLTAVELLRPNVKLEKHVADEMNLQSHNSRRRFYPAGSITNGNKETIKAK
jgi:hypothetical protein